MRPEVGGAPGVERLAAACFVARVRERTTLSALGITTPLCSTGMVQVFPEAGTLGIAKGETPTIPETGANGVATPHRPGTADGGAEDRGAAEGGGRNRYFESVGRAELGTEGSSDVGCEIVSRGASGFGAGASGRGTAAGPQRKPWSEVAAKSRLRRCKLTASSAACASARASRAARSYSSSDS